MQLVYFENNIMDKEFNQNVPNDLNLQIYVLEFEKYIKQFPLIYNQILKIQLHRSFLFWNYS